MLTTASANDFALQWVDAWNRHDLDAVMSHYAQDIRFSSPFVISVAAEPSGVLVGREALRAYWARALARRPGLHFKIQSVLVGVDSLVIVYSRDDGRTGAEHFRFQEDGLVCSSSAHYADAGA